MGTVYNSEGKICSVYRENPSKFIEDILKVHNQYRAIHNSPPLQIDEKVALFSLSRELFVWKFHRIRNFFSNSITYRCLLFRERQCREKKTVIRSEIILVLYYLCRCLKLCSWTSVLSSWRRVYREMEKKRWRKLIYHMAKMCTSDIRTGGCFPKSRCNIGENFARQILTCKWKVI